ncbi:hypothetical protein S7711_03443 [Stachybotrys chartarum IBT 7711]|uniref:Methyltransferase n=1 Tax=Stachybotrys chartarum (strain CBS 109288 / IBT 7711) TaxID=1280523 RepID=A0A084AFS0_STACB|nr:hypothetical protein S7711_03443 [Stachybotrys chartarum IBT 7711]
MTEVVTASIRYVQRDENRLTSEKPYILHYDAPEGFPQNNFTIQSYSGIQIQNLRSAGLSYEEHGLAIAPLGNSGWDPALFDDDDWIEQTYLPELHRSVCKELGAKDMTVFDWMLRKRSASFPERNQDEVNVEAVQPSLSAHIDYTTKELDGRLDQYFGDKKESFMKREYHVINIWRPLSGPCRDFPMAYLDPKSVDRDADLFAVDEVFPNVANEVYQVYHNPNHKWYYVPDQLESEVVIFNAYDSKKGQANAVPHCSFDLGELRSGPPRQSIEVRAFVFF